MISVTIICEDGSVFSNHSHRQEGGESICDSQYKEASVSVSGSGRKPVFPSVPNSVGISIFSLIVLSVMMPGFLCFHL